MATEGSLGTSALHRALVKRTEWERRLSGDPLQGASAGQGTLLTARQDRELSVAPWLTGAVQRA
jgi:hypothetical protein